MDRIIQPLHYTANIFWKHLGQSRRLSKDYERLCETSEAMIYATMSRLMVRRLAAA